MKEYAAHLYRLYISYMKLAFAAIALSSITFYSYEVLTNSQTIGEKLWATVLLFLILSSMLIGICCWIFEKKKRKLLRQIDVLLNDINRMPDQIVGGIIMPNPLYWIDYNLVRIEYRIRKFSYSTFLKSPFYSFKIFKEARKIYADALLKYKVFDSELQERKNESSRKTNA